MCGIIGVASVYKADKKKWLNIGRDTLKHRGPDDKGEWWSPDNKVGFGHRRLSIFDLSNAARQPMHFNNKQLTIIFNGEIYNFLILREELNKAGYCFKTNSDTEVILAAYKHWGNKFVNRLNGMFAIAIFDAQSQKLFLARDRAGEKPLFYRYEPGKSICFASELKGLMINKKTTPNLNYRSLDYYLMMGYVPNEMCILEGYNKLPPAYALEFDTKTGYLKKWCYWDIPQLNAQSRVSLSENELLDELESLLENSVKLQLEADVPVGVLLSGGIDSSLVTAMAVRSSNKVKTYTISFPGHGNLDEADHARLISRHFGTKHTELIAEQASAKLLPLLAKQFDEPMCDSSMLPTYLVSELVRRECTVALGGDGGDELFGGYGSYSKLLWMKEHFSKIPLFLRRYLSYAAENCLPVGFKGRNWMQGIGHDFQNRLPIMPSFFDKNTRQKLMGFYPDWSSTAENYMLKLLPEDPDILQRATRMDFKNYLAEDILVKVDRASMLNSLEVRAPFLDYRIIEFAFGKTPSHLKSTKFDKKILLKKLTERILPKEFNRSRKQGFSIPLANWLKEGPFRDLFHSVLLDKNCIFEKKIVLNLLNGQSKGFSNSERLFNLVIFELWRNEYNISA